MTIDKSWIRLPNRRSPTIDKSWIKLPNRRSPKFLKGLNKFIEIAKNHVDDEGKVCCPCKDCVNVYRQIVTTVYAHICDRGFLQSYLIWTHHGEEYPALYLSYLDNISAPRKRTTTRHEMFDAIDGVRAKQNTNEENTKNRAKQLYPSSHESESYAPKRHKKMKKMGKTKHIEGWKNSHFKEGRGWCNPRARDDWSKIQNEYRKMLEEAGGDKSSINEVKCLKRAFGERRGYKWGVGRKPKHVSPNYAPSTSANNENLIAMGQQVAEQLSQQFTQQMQQMMLSLNPNSQPLPPFQFHFDPTQLQVLNKPVIIYDEDDDLQSSSEDD